MQNLNNWGLCGEFGRLAPHQHVRGSHSLPYSVVVWSRWSFFFTDIFLLTKMFVLGWYYQSKPIRLTFDSHFCKWNYWTPSLAVRQPCCRMITYVQLSFTFRGVFFLNPTMCWWKQCQAVEFGIGVFYRLFLVRSVWRIPRPRPAPKLRPIFH